MRVPHRETQNKRTWRRSPGGSPPLGLCRRAAEVDRKGHVGAHRGSESPTRIGLPADSPPDHSPTRCAAGSAYPIKSPCFCIFDNPDLVVRHSLSPPRTTAVPCQWLHCSYALFTSRKICGAGLSASLINNHFIRRDGKIKTVSPCSKPTGSTEEENVS